MATKKARTPTMQDVACGAGVSQATVSLVLNGVTGVRISERTRERVIEVANALGYRRGSRLKADERAGSVIGLLIDDVSASPFAAPLIEGAREAAWGHQCIVNTVSTRNDPAIESAAIESMLAQSAVGIIYATLITRQVAPPTLPSDFPVVLLNCYAEDESFAAVTPDDLGGAFALTNALLAAGHTRIAHLSGETWLDAGRDRLEGYRAALEDRGIPFDQRLVINHGSTVSSGIQGTQKLLDLKDPPTAVFCFNDRMAIGAIEAARMRGLRVPQDMSVVGFDNDPFATSLVPGGLTTAVLPHEEMAGWAVDRLIDMHNKRGIAEPPRWRAACPIVRRKSIARRTRRNL